MKNDVLVNFYVDKENKKISVERTFKAPLEKVWAAFTEKEILDQWWAPKPWRTQTKSLNFTVGGYWLYAMKGPEGETHWCRADYKSINDLKAFRLKMLFVMRTAPSIMVCQLPYGRMNSMKKMEIQ